MRNSWPDYIGILTHDIVCNGNIKRLIDSKLMHARFGSARYRCYLLRRNKINEPDLFKLLRLFDTPTDAVVICSALIIELWCALEERSNLLLARQDKRFFRIPRPS